MSCQREGYKIRKGYLRGMGKLEGGNRGWVWSYYIAYMDELIKDKSVEHNWPSEKYKLKSDTPPHPSQSGYCQENETTSSGKNVGRRNTHPLLVVGALVQQWWESVRKFSKNQNLNEHVTQLDHSWTYVQRTLALTTCYLLIHAHCCSVTITRKWDQPRCPSVDEWVLEMRCLHSGILFSGKKIWNY